MYRSIKIQNTYKFKALTSFLVTQVVVNSFRVLGCDFRMVFTKTLLYLLEPSILPIE